MVGLMLGWLFGLLEDASVVAGRLDSTGVLGSSQIVRLVVITVAGLLDCDFTDADELDEGGLDDEPALEDIFLPAVLVDTPLTLMAVGTILRDGPGMLLKIDCVPKFGATKCVLSSLDDCTLLVLGRPEVVLVAG